MLDLRKGAGRSAGRSPHMLPRAGASGKSASAVIGLAPARHHGRYVGSDSGYSQPGTNPVIAAVSRNPLDSTVGTPRSGKAIGEELMAGGKIGPAARLFAAYPGFRARLARSFTRPWLAADRVV